MLVPVYDILHPLLKDIVDVYIGFFEVCARGKQLLGKAISERRRMGKLVVMPSLLQVFPQSLVAGLEGLYS